MVSVQAKGSLACDRLTVISSDKTAAFMSYYFVMQHDISEIMILWLWSKAIMFKIYSNVNHSYIYRISYIWCGEVSLVEENHTDFCYTC